MTDDDYTQLDRLRSAYLGDNGLVGYSAGVAVDASGNVFFVLVELNADEDALLDFTCHDVEHEQLGALSAEWIQRIHEAGSDNG